MCKKNRRSEKEGDVKSGLDFFFGGGEGRGVFKTQGLAHMLWKGIHCYKSSIIEIHSSLLNKILETDQTVFQI